MSILPMVVVMAGLPATQGSVVTCALSKDLPLASLTTGCQLVIDGAPDGFPAAYLRCVTGVNKVLSSLKDLRGFAHIETEQQALEFVRLFSVQGRWRLSGIADYAEPVPSDQDAQECFLVRRARFKTCCTEARVTSRREANDGGTAFEVSRLLVDQKYRVYRVKEVVGQDGSYDLVARKRLRLRGEALGSFTLFTY